MFSLMWVLPSPASLGACSCVRLSIGWEYILNPCAPKGPHTRVRVHELNHTVRVAWEAEASGRFPWKPLCCQGDGPGAHRRPR